MTYRDSFGQVFHKYFRIADGKTEEDSKKIYDVWKAIDALPDYAWNKAIDETFDFVNEFFETEKKTEIVEKVFAVEHSAAHDDDSIILGVFKEEEKAIELIEKCKVDREKGVEDFKFTKVWEKIPNGWILRDKKFGDEVWRYIEWVVK